jgi:RHS repeat-associated protein
MSRALVLAVLVGAVPVSLAQSDVVLDNTAPHFTTTGAWPTSTSVGGYIGSNYQTHEPNGIPPAAVAVDNSDAGFSVTGTWPASTSVSGYLGSNYSLREANGPPPTAIVADNLSGSFTGTWPASTSVGGYYATNYQTHPAGTGANVFTWSLAVASAGTYEVYARWTAHPNRATNAKYTVNHASGSNVTVVNQEQNSGAWVLLGSYSFNAGATSVSLSDDADDYVIADAVMLVPLGAQPNTATWTLNVPSEGSYNIYARWTAHPNRATDAKYTVNHAGGAAQVTANQQANAGTWNLLGTYSFNAGNATVTLTDQANGYVIADAVMLAPPGAASNTATWTPNVAQAGTYEVYARWTANPNRATNATYMVTHGQGSTNVPVNQQANGGAWNLLGTFQLSPGSTHKVALSDQANGYVIADAIRLVPISLQPALSLYYIHPDHLNTVRLIANITGTTVWRNDNTEPFGNNPVNENPSGLGVFPFPLRESNYYHDTETNQRYAMYRDCYDSATGRFCQSDPIGQFGGLNVYASVRSNPLHNSDRLGLWSPEGHDRIYEFSLADRLSPAELQHVQTAGRQFDLRTQGLDQTQMHSLLRPGQSVAEMIEVRDSAIEAMLLQARGFAMAGNRARALTRFAEACHAGMDADSPAHRDAQGRPRVWDPRDPRTWWGHSPNERVGGETARQLTPEILRNQRRDIQMMYDFVFGR